MRENVIVSPPAAGLPSVRRTKIDNQNKSITDFVVMLFGSSSASREWEFPPAIATALCSFVAILA